MLPSRISGARTGRFQWLTHGGVVAWRGWGGKVAPVLKLMVKCVGLRGTQLLTDAVSGKAHDDDFLDRRTLGLCSRWYCCG